MLSILLLPKQASAKTYRASFWFQRRGWFSPSKSVVVRGGGGASPETALQLTEHNKQLFGSTSNLSSTENALAADDGLITTGSVTGSDNRGQPPLPTSSTVPAWKDALPEQLRRKGPKTLQMIRLGEVDIYLLGTAHVSNDSSADVQLLLDAVRPDCIFVELCEARIPLLEGTKDNNESLANNKTSSSFLERIKFTQQAQGGSRLQALSTILLTSVQEDYAQELGVELGGEFRCAHAHWLNQSASTRPHLILGDRPLYLTLVRAWESLSWWPKVKVILGLVWSSLRKPNKEEIRQWLQSVLQEESDVLTESFQELRKHFPTLYTTIISERDAWLAAKLVQTCRTLSLSSSNNNPTLLRHHHPRKISVVAIVGAGHVPGICQWLTHPPTAEATPEHVLAQLVSTRRWSKDPVVQNEAIPVWIYEVSALHDTSALTNDNVAATAVTT